MMRTGLGGAPASRQTGERRQTGHHGATAEADGTPAMSRRNVLKAALFTGAALALPTKRYVQAKWDDGRIAESKLPKPFSLPFREPPVAIPVRTSDDADIYRIAMQQVNAEVIPGYRTPLYSYGGSVPGPTIHATRGRRTVVRFANQLPATHPTLRYPSWTSVHLHGSASLPQYDGYASDITSPGSYKDYHYPNHQPARTLWYHDHGVHHTAENAYHGLAGQYHLHDELESGLPIPKAPYDKPLIISDMMFRSDGSLLFSLENENGLYGDVVLVNGVPWPTLVVEPRKYRFRVLNACISRSVQLSLSTGDPFKIIASDGGFLPAPQPVSSYRHGNGERVEIVIDFARYAPNTEIVLRNTTPPNNAGYTHTDKVMKFIVRGSASRTSDNAVPDLLCASAVMDLQPAAAVATRTFDLHRSGGMWRVNEHTWDDIVASGYRLVECSPLEGSVERWVVTNKSGGWFHPFHVHLVDFKVLTRNGLPPSPHERGPKDVIYMGENEQVELLLRFEGRGRYMVHCHNLIHEDHDMMTQFEVIGADGPGPDPLGTPSKPLTMEPADPL